MQNAKLKSYNYWLPLTILLLSRVTRHASLVFCHMSLVLFFHIRRRTLIKIMCMQQVVRLLTQGFS
jgi:hypothetical protein